MCIWKRNTSFNLKFRSVISIFNAEESRAVKFIFPVKNSLIFAALWAWASWSLNPLQQDGGENQKQEKEVPCGSLKWGESARGGNYLPPSDQCPVIPQAMATQSNFQSVGGSCLLAASCPLRWHHATAVQQKLITSVCYQHYLFTSLEATHGLLHRKLTPPQSNSVQLYSASSLTNTWNKEL